MHRLFVGASLGLAILFSTGALADDAPASPKDVMNILLVTGAVVDYCKFQVDPAIQDKMQVKVATLQKQLNWSDDDLVAAAKQITDSVASQKADCAPTGDLAKSIQQVVDDMKTE